MKTKLMDNLYVAWAIGLKDIVDALKNKATRTNIILIMGMVVFFYWASTLRPFDKRIDTAVYDEGHSSLTSGTVELADGYTFRFYKATSVHEMERMMGYKQLGVVIPADFDQTLASGGEATRPRRCSTSARLLTWPGRSSRPWVEQGSILRGTLTSRPHGGKLVADTYGETREEA